MFEVWKSAGGTRDSLQLMMKKKIDTCGQTHVGIRDTQYALWLSSGIHDGHGLTHSTTRFRIRNLDSNGTGQAGRQAPRLSSGLRTQASDIAEKFGVTRGDSVTC